MMRFFLDDCRALHSKALLSDEQLRAWETVTVDGEATSDDTIKSLRVQLRALLQHELDEIIHRIRVEQNEKHQENIRDTDLVAITAGGLLGALNAWMRPAPTPTGSPPRTSLWASVFDAAQASLNVVRQRRLLDHLHIKHMTGDELSADHVVLCINGFMTQGLADPSNNWRPWANDSRVVMYAVLWEAGDIEAWNEFCAHANDNSLTTHDLLTHFTGNPWHKAQDKAEQVGILLAQVLASNPIFTRGRRVSLLGHSLGGAVIYSTLNELARLRREGLVADETKKFVWNAILFAAAFVPEPHGLDAMANEVEDDGKIVNVYSQRDNVLTTLFWAVQLHGRDAVAAGCAPIDFAAAQAQSNSVNVNVSDLVPPRMPNQFGHSYGMYMELIRKRVLPHVPLMMLDE